MAIKQIKTPDGVSHDIYAIYDGSGNNIEGSYLPLAGGTLIGELNFNTGTTQSATKGIKWTAINNNAPYIGYATDQVDGTFILGSLKGTGYQTGLAIGGGSGNLLWKGVKVATINDIPSIPTAIAVFG